ncbi:MAG TPA: phage integrase N-terminal SAM-like domain-containing protein, partial [Bacteroidia bacterium]|nr:phage integrase N-terminal SAM-like domain-containing protein [Bacteroidia bacterium]
MLTIILDRTIVDGRKFTTLQFPYHTLLVELTRKIPGAKWYYPLRKWLVPPSRVDKTFLGKHFEGVAVIDDTALIAVLERERVQHHLSRYGDLPDETIAQVGHFEQYLRTKRYSDNTIKAYKDAVLVFLKFFSGKKIAEITNEDLVIFHDRYILANRLSSSFQNQVINAVKLLFRRINNTLIDVDVVYRPKREYRLPNVLSKEEVNELLLGSKNIKHRSMLSLIYSCGLRRSELLNLKLTDV